MSPGMIQKPNPPKPQTLTKQTNNPPQIPPPTTTKNIIGTNFTALIKDNSKCIKDLKIRLNYIGKIIDKSLFAIDLRNIFDCFIPLSKITITKPAIKKDIIHMFIAVLVN